MFPFRKSHIFVNTDYAHTQSKHVTRAETGVFSFSSSPLAHSDVQVIELRDRDSRVDFS